MGFLRNPTVVFQIDVIDYIPQNIYCSSTRPLKDEKTRNLRDNLIKLQNDWITQQSYNLGGHDPHIESIHESHYIVLAET